MSLALLVSCVLPSADRAAASLSGGTQRWAASYLHGGPAFSYAVGISPDGATVFVSGATISGSKPGDAATLAYDAATGADKWVATYSSSSHARQNDRMNRLVVSPDGSKVFVTGQSICFSCSGTHFHGWSTLAYDASTGAELWVAQHAADIGAFSIAVSPDGSKLFVSGQEGGGLRSATIAYDASTGEELWVIQSDDSPVYWRALAVSPDSSTVFVVGAGGTFDGDYHTTAYDAADGTERWSALYYGSIPTGLTLSADGSTVFVTGYDETSFAGASATVAYDASTGEQLWAIQDDRIYVLGGETTVDVAVSPDGSKVFVSGYDCVVSECGTDRPFVTVAYEAATGTGLWVSRYRSGGQNYLNDLAVSPDGSKVFVTGQETMPCYSPCTLAQINAPVVAYDAATGDELWVVDYENNLGWALAVSPDGSNVYLAGTFTTSTATSSAVTAREDGGSAASTECSPTACGYSTAAYNSGPGPGTSQDRDPSVKYEGWRNFFDKTAFGGAYRASRVGGDTASYRTARTTSVVWLTHVGPNQGKAKVVIDGRSKGTFDLYSPTSSARSFTFRGLARVAHLVEIKVLGTKRVASSGTWVAVDGFKVGGNITVESSLRIRYDTWAGKAKSAASGGSYRKSGSSGASVSFEFTGSDIAWVTARGPAYGRAKVVIDGVARIVDLYRRTQDWRVTLWYTGLSEGRHRITIRPLGTKHASSSSTNIVFDAFVVRA